MAKVEVSVDGKIVATAEIEDVSVETRRYEVVSAKLRVRPLPSTSQAEIDYLNAGDEVEGIGEDSDGQYYWVQLGKGRWAARGQMHDPYQFMKLLDDVEPDPDPEPEPEGRRWPSGRFGAELRQKSSQRWWQPTIDGERINWVGVDMRPAAFAGIGIDPFKASTMERLIETVKKAKETKFNIVRFYATLDSVDDPGFLVARVKAFLDILHQNGMYGYICVTDAIRAYHNLKGDLGFYRDGSQGGVYISNGFFAGGYNQHYMPFVRQLLLAVGQHPALIAIEPMNEWSINYQRQGTRSDWLSAMNFMQDFCDTVQELAPHLYVADGLLCLEHTTPDGLTPIEAGLDLFSIENLHIHTFHMYEDKGVEPGANWEHQETIVENDVPAAHEGDVMLWWTEWGPHNENEHLTRSQVLKADQMVIPHHITGLMQWGFWFGEDVNTTDRAHGLSNPFYHQWDGTIAWYFDVFIPFMQGENML